VSVFEPLMQTSPTPSAHTKARGSMRQMSAMRPAACHVMTRATFSSSLVNGSVALGGRLARYHASGPAGIVLRDREGALWSWLFTMPLAAIAKS
jgi:hypothetical protein